jgi:hypothetical protein
MVVVLGHFLHEALLEAGLVDLFFFVPALTHIEAAAPFGGLY